MSNQMFNLTAVPFSALNGWELAAALGFYLAFGLALGSFATMAVHRWPAGEAWVRARSYCPACRAPLAARQLIPLVSWAWQRGRCGFCRAPIPARYPLMELAAALAAAASLWRFGAGAESVLVTVLLVLLMILAVVDIRHYIIPDQVQAGVAATGLMHATLEGRLAAHALTGAGALLAGWLLAAAYRQVRRREGLGMGDVKFFGAAGCWLGGMGFLPFLCLGSALGTAFGAVWSRRNLGAPFPFGPGLAAALAVCVLYPATVEGFWRLMTAFVAAVFLGGGDA